MRYFEALKIWNDQKKAGKWLLPQTEKDALEILKIMNTGKKEVEVVKVEKKKPRIRVGGKEVSKEEFKELKAKKARSEKETKVKDFLKKAIAKLRTRKRMELQKRKDALEDIDDVLDYAEANAFEDMSNEEIGVYDVSTGGGFIIIQYDDFSKYERQVLDRRGYRIRKNVAGGDQATKTIKK